jgi:hypothetical protein
MSYRTLRLFTAAHEPWVVLLLLMAALCFRLPGVTWGLSDHDYFEPDEFQHTGIAKSFMADVSRSSVSSADGGSQWNARAFGVQTGVVSVKWWKSRHLLTS